MLFASRGRKVGPAIFDRRHRRLTQGLVGYWSPALTGPTGTQLLDLGGQSFNGTLTNMDPPTDWIHSRYGYALDFDGSNDFVTFGNASVVTTGRPFFVSSWFRTSINGNQSIVAKSLLGGASHRWWLSTETGFVAVNGTQSATGVAATFSTNYADGNWHHIAGLYNGTTMSLFYDGLFRSSITITQLDASSYTLLFGKYNDGSGGSTGTTAQFNGQISDVGMWNRPFTDGGVMSLFALGPGKLGAPNRLIFGIFEATIAYSMLADSRSYALSGISIPLLYGRSIPADTASVLLQGQTTQLLVSRLLGADRGTYDVSGFDAGLLLGRLLDAGATAYTVNGTSSGLIATRRISADSVAYLASGQDAAFLRGRVIQAGTGQYILVASPIDIQTGTGGAAPYYYLFLLGGSR